MITPSEVPKTWEDLLHPRLRSKISADATKAQWFITQLERMGEDKGMVYMKKLSEQQVIRDPMQRGFLSITSFLLKGRLS